MPSRPVTPLIWLPLIFCILAVTAKEMKSYLNDKVPYRAQRMHSRKQTPQMFGQATDRVLVRYE